MGMAPDLQDETVIAPLVWRFAAPLLTESQLLIPLLSFEPDPSAELRYTNVRPSPVKHCRS